MQIVADLINDGVPDYIIARQQAEEWGCDRRSVRRYIRSALAAMAKEEDQQNRKTLRAWHYRQRKRVIDLAIARGNVATALRGLDSLARLQGMHDRSPEDDGLVHGVGGSKS